MWKSEAEWIHDEIVEHGLVDASVDCLNLGSSTREYRQVKKPYIDELIIVPLMRTGRVVNVDVKPADGVDEVGDFADPAFIDRLASRRYGLILCNNVLTHVHDVEPVFEAIDRCAAEQGYVIITAPRIYPYCADPYDAKFRPSVADIQALLPGFRTMSSCRLTGSETHASRLASNLRLSLSLAANLVLPIAGMTRWRDVVSDLPNLFTRFETTCVMMQRRDPEGGDGASVTREHSTAR